MKKIMIMAAFMAFCSAGAAIAQSNAKIDQQPAAKSTTAKEAKKEDAPKGKSCCQGKKACGSGKAEAKSCGDAKETKAHATTEEKK